MSKSHYLVIGTAAAAFVFVYVAAQRHSRSAEGEPLKTKAAVESNLDAADRERSGSSSSSELPSHHPVNVPQSRIVADDPTEHTDLESASSGPSGFETAKDMSVSVEPELDDPALDFSVAGRPFPLSDSVRRTCAGQRNGASECSELLSFIKSFSEEPRDVSWAASIESRIAEFVGESRGGDAKVRSVECRRDRCVLEVEAPHQFVLTEFDRDPVLNRELREGTGDLGFERRAGEQEIVVTVSALTRRR